MVSGVSEYSGQGGVHTTPTVQCGNIYEWWKYYPFCKEGQVSDRDKRWINFLGYENYMVPWGGPSIWIIQVKGQKLNCIGVWSTNTPSTLRVIPSGVLNRFSKLTSREPYFNSERLDNVHPDHISALRKVVIAPPSLFTMGWLWKGKDWKWILIIKKNLKSTKIKTGISIFALHTHVSFLHISTGWLIS